jgi:hypothetical protein
MVGAAQQQAAATAVLSDKMASVAEYIAAPAEIIRDGQGRPVRAQKN